MGAEDAAVAQEGGAGLGLQGWGGALVWPSRSQWQPVAVRGWLWRVGGRTLFYMCQAAAYWQQQCRRTACPAEVAAASLTARAP